MLTFNLKHNLFAWQGTFEQRHLPEKAGFEWNNISKVWWTASPYIAYLLRKHSDQGAGKQLLQLDRNLQASAQYSNILTNYIPAPERLKYLPFQEAGIDHMARQLRSRKTILCADEQGLGKTVQAIGIANTLGYKKLLVICPASLRLNWAREIEKWHLHSPGVDPVITGGSRFNSKVSVIISYHLAEKVKNYKPDFIVIDEGHYIKNPQSKRTQLILGNVQERWSGLIARAPSIILTGTPLPNGKPNELWPILYKCAPDSINYMKSWPFMRRFCELEFDDDGESRVIGAKRKLELFTRLRGSGFMTRRLKKDVLKDLPPKRYKMVVFPASGPMKKILDKESSFNANEILKHGVPEVSALPEIRREMGVAKTPQAVEYISNLLDSGVKKLLVFAYHIEVNQILEEKLRRYNPVLIIGSTPVIKRQQYVDTFQSDPRVRVAIGNLKSMGTGWTMTKAHDVIFVEGDWVPGENDQCADRVHRIGQYDRVMLHFLVVQGSLDGRILGSAAMKSKDSKEVLDNGN